LPDRFDSFPLFPLGIVLLPTEVVPLHIFDERYKLMIGECLDSGREFGIVWLADDGLREVGCTAEVTRLLEQMEDGRMNILVRGAAPFRMLRRIEDLPYPAGDVELLDDLEPDPHPDTAAEARERFAQLVERATDERPADDDLAALDAYSMAARLEFLALDAKQELLELRSEEARLKMVGELFSVTMKRLEQAEQAAERASGNGKVPLG
jgi:Lon protease-like protein